MWNLETLRGDGTMILLSNYEKTSAKLEKLLKRNDYEFMDFVYKLIKDLPIFQEAPTDMQHKKSDEISLIYRKEGNELFIRKKDNYRALQMYTKSIAIAENEGENLSIAYANRSAVLFENKYYKECLVDIERALNTKYPDNLKQKLLHRQEKAKNLVFSQKSYMYHEALPEIKNRNPLISSASDLVEIQKNEKWGRHVVATKNIKAGEVLIVEKPYAQEVDPASKYLHCHECLELCYNMIPCESCTEVLYCSRSCREQANKTYHKFECILFQLGLHEQRLFLRIVLKGVSEYKNLTDNANGSKTGVYRSDSYKEIYELVTHRQERNAYDLYQDSLEPVVFYHYLKNYTDILKETDIEHKEHILKELLLHHCLSVHCNATCIEKPKLRDLGVTEYEKVGNVIYSFHSTLNHSCNANTFPVSYGSYMVIRAQNDIKKGEQVTVSYGFSYNNCSKFERQFKLQKHYHFNCACVACANDWPTNENLRPGKDFPKFFIQKVLKLYTLETVNKKAVNKLLSEAFNIASTMKSTAPSRNLNFINGIICDLFIFLGNRILDF